jgi:hypothetical protein
MGALAAADETSNLTGTAYTTTLRPLSKVEVQVRNLQTGMRVNSIFSGENGEFAFKGLEPGTYIIEVVDRSGRVLGMSAPFTLAAASTGNVSVVAVAQGMVSAGERAGFSLLGLGPTTSLAVVGAASAAAVTAVVSTRQDASPSR